MRFFGLMTLLASAFVMAFASVPARAAELDADKQAKLNAAIEQAKQWAADPAVVSAVKSYNATPSDDAKAMTQDKWKSLPVLDSFVRSHTKNDAAKAIAAHKTEATTEAFLSGANGTKVAFLSKPSNWSHKGKAKHDDPMAGKVWQGAVEVDDSTGQQQIQIAVPVKDGDTVIGSLVVGFSVAKL